MNLLTLSPKPLFIVTISSLILLLSSCASVTGFEDGRSNDADVFSITGSINKSGQPKLNTILDPEETFQPDIILELAGRYGVNKNFDVGFKVSSNYNASYTMKYQIAGTKTGRGAISLGAEINSNFASQFMAYLSVHPSNAFSLYAIPRVVACPDGSSAYGSNFGFMVGEDSQFGLDIGTFTTRGSEFTKGSLNWVNFGFGAKRYFGRNKKKKQ